MKVPDLTLEKFPGNDSISFYSKRNVEVCQTKLRYLFQGFSWKKDTFQFALSWRSVRIIGQVVIDTYSSAIISS